MLAICSGSCIASDANAGQRSEKDSEGPARLDDCQLDGEQVEYRSALCSSGCGGYYE